MAGPFHYGYAYVCNGCYRERIKSPEHPSLAFYPGADTFYINKKGEKVIPQNKRSHANDLILDTGYLPYPFRHTPSKQKIVDSFDRMEVTSKIAYMNYYLSRTGLAARLQFEMIEKPSEENNHIYVLMGFDRQDGDFRQRKAWYSKWTGRGTGSAKTPNGLYLLKPG